MPDLSLEGIRSLLLTNDKAVLRGLLRIYERQTADEQRAGYTKKQNGEGFNGPDSAVMTVYAKHVLAGYTLPSADFEDCRQRMLKYSGQLLAIAMEIESERMLKQLEL